MAKVTIKGKKVTGTKKKDKITWQNKKAWKKALTVNAGAGNDVINFAKSNYKNTINGQAGSDKITGGKKNDKITGGIGNDTINAGLGNNTLYFSKGDGKDTVLNGKGTDTLVFKTEKNINNIKAAYSGNNVIVTYTGGSVILKDYKKGGHSAKYIQVGSTKKAVADYLKPPVPPTPVINEITGTEDDDVLTGTNSPDRIYGLGGNDEIFGGAGNDTLIGGDGGDEIGGGPGNDKIDGGAGGDELYGNEGNDTLTGGDGDDCFIVGPNDGYDVITDATNNEYISFEYQYDFSKFSFTRGTTTGHETSLYVTYDNGVGNNVVEIQGYFTFNTEIQEYVMSDNALKRFVLYDEEAAPGVYHTEYTLEWKKSPITNKYGMYAIIDTPDSIHQLIGIDGINNYITSGTNAESLFGRNKDDILLGGAGNDYIVGMAGNDYMDGGEGTDIYNISNASELKVIADSGSTANDTVSLEGINKANLKVFYDVTYNAGGNIYNSLYIYNEDDFDGTCLRIDQKATQNTQLVGSINTKDHYSMTNISALAEATATWLSTNAADYGYSAMNIMNSTNDTLKAELLAIADNYWQHA